MLYALQVHNLDNESSASDLIPLNLLSPASISSSCCGWFDSESHKNTVPSKEPVKTFDFDRVVKMDSIFEVLSIVAMQSISPGFYVGRFELVFLEEKKEQK